jgi:hypothetical protein
MGASYEEMNQSEDAIRAYERFIQMAGDSEAEQVRDAESRMEKLLNSRGLE